MRIYKIRLDLNNWWLVHVDIDNIGSFTFDCESVISDWNSIEVYVHNPKKMMADFSTVGNSGTFVFSEKVYNSDLLAFLEMAGEILPISVAGEKYYLLNILDCINALDKDSSEYLLQRGKKIRITKPAIYCNRLGESSLFKLPETSKSEMFCYGIEEVEGFKSTYERLGFDGLLFEEVISI
jgi:hypothetical protein